MRIDPMALVSATAAPVIPAKIMLMTTLIYASPPRTGPTRTLQKVTSLRVRPPALMMFPARIKKGIAMSTGLSIPVKIRWAASMSGVSPS